jgi:hypothetical protein
MLCTAAGLRDETDEAVQVFRSLSSPWGEAPLGQRSTWASEISDDHTPVELSVALGGEQTEVRVLFEAQGAEPVLGAFRTAALALTGRLEREFGADLGRFRAVEDLFVPADMEGPFALWHSVVFAPGRRPSFKAYLNAQARGPVGAESLVREALDRLGLGRAWAALERGPLRRGPYLDELKYLALDLSCEPRARVKVYVRHHHATSDDLEAAASSAEDHLPGEARAFVRSMRGEDAPLAARAAFTCDAFVEGCAGPAAASTIYVPVCAYARDDAEVRKRVGEYLGQKGLDPSLYQSICDGFANRPLEAGVGMQSWVALRRHPRAPRLTVYLGTEAYRVYAPGVVPAPTPARAPANAAVSETKDGASTMRTVLEAVDRKALEFSQARLFEFLQDESIDPRERLAFAPSVAHFVMTFADLYALVLRDEPARDRHQELVNAHAREDGGHWRWFLADLDTLSRDPSLRLSDALRLIWSEGTKKMRMLSYHMCRLGFGADSLRKLVLVHCIEATGKVTVKHVAKVGKQIATRTGKRLLYFGEHHFATESDHTLEEEGVRRALEETPLEPLVARELCSLVDESFLHFTAFADEMLAIARAERERACKRSA